MRKFLGVEQDRGTGKQRARREPTKDAVPMQKRKSKL